MCFRYAELTREGIMKIKEEATYKYKTTIIKMENKYGLFKIICWCHYTTYHKCSLNSNFQFWLCYLRYFCLYLSRNFSKANTSAYLRYSCGFRRFSLTWQKMKVKNYFFHLKRNFLTNQYYTIILLYYYSTILLLSELI